MPNRVQWEPDLAVGHTLIDAQHQGLLAQCNRLAELCEAGEGDGSRLAFEQAFDRLKAQAREHFVTEANLLAGGDPADLEGLQDEFDEFEYLAGEVATTGNFDPLEVQRFLALWCLGHIRGTVEGLRIHLASQGPPEAS